MAIVVSVFIISIIFSKSTWPIIPKLHVEVTSMQRSGTEEIRTQIQPSKPKQEITKITNSQKNKENMKQGAIARSVAMSLGNQEAPRSILASGTSFREDLVMKSFLRPFFLFR